MVPGRGKKINSNTAKKKYLCFFLPYAINRAYSERELIMSKEEFVFEVGDIITNPLGTRVPYIITAITAFSGDLLVQPINRNNKDINSTWLSRRNVERRLARGALTIQKKDRRNVILKGALRARLEPERRSKRCVESNFVLPRHRVGDILQSSDIGDLELYRRIIRRWLVG